MAWSSPKIPQSPWRPAVLTRIGRLRVSRLLSYVTALVVTASLLVTMPAPARAAGFEPRPVQTIPSVPVKPMPVLPTEADPAAAAAARPRVAPVWPAAATAVVDLRQSATTSADPVQAAQGAGRTRAGTMPVYVAPVTVAARGVSQVAAAGPSAVRVEVLDRASNPAVWSSAVLLRLSPAGAGSAGSVRVSVDYSGFRNAFGADWSTRLRLVRLPECALTRPGENQCRATDLASLNDSGRAEVSADVALPATGSVAAEAGGGALLALASGPSGPAGSFTATSLSPSSTWQAGGSSGDFNWSYPLRVPPSAGGPAPSLGLSYSSQSVDGRTEASNNQPSTVGEGFDLSVGGFVERRYASCADDMGGTANNTDRTGDQCWATDNATLSMAGHSGELIYNSTEGLWHLRRDDGTRVQKLTGATNGTQGGEHWKVTTADGTQYFFGLNHLPGWAAGRPETQSALTSAVFGNNPGEPCHQSTFDASWCQQGYRWNLDYVVDTHGNSMSLWYTQETNKYARVGDSAKLTPYVRGSYLTRVDYGTRTASEFGTVPMRVDLGMVDRCDSGCSVHDGAHWTDTPWDTECTASPCLTGSPTFWVTKRLATITTRVWGGSAYRDVDLWSLRHTYPDNGDATRAGLWLAGITHTGLVGGSLAMPEVTFTGVQMNNRVDTSTDQLPAMNWWRIRKITNEAGGDVTVAYSAPDCIAGSRMPASPESNTLRCQPVRGTFQGQPDRVDWFHKYVVTAVMQTDHTGGGVRSVAAYEYVGTPAWHHDDADGLVPAKRKSWAQWRGYNRVRVRQGDPGEQTLIETLFYQGMDGDQLPGGGVRHVQVTPSEGAAVDDSDALAGLQRETITYDVPTMAVVGGSVTEAWQSGPTASRTIDGETVSARVVRMSGVRTRVALDGGRGQRRGMVTNSFGAYGLPSTVDDSGDVAVTGDERCTRYSYAPNTGPWLIAAVTRVETVAKPCSQPATSEADIVSDVRTSYDGQAWGAAPTKGDVTRSESISAWSPSGSTYLTTRRWAFDDYGRVTDTWDGLDYRTTTGYTPSTSAPVTSVTSTNPLGHITTAVNEPAWGAVKSTVDANNKRTDVDYDPLGHTAAVWLPGRTKGVDTANSVFSYQFRTDGATTVTSRTLNAAGNYVTSYTLYDSLLRERQSQSPSPVGGGRIITDSFYDSQGREMLRYGAYYNSSAPGGDLVTPANAALVPSQTKTVYDGAGRVSASIFQPGGIEKWRTTRTYGGDRIDATPPVGASASSTVLDIKGNTVQLKQYHGNTPTGTPDTTTYQYDRRGLLETVTDPAGNFWRTTYDIRGRVIRTDDPDRGITKLTYNNADQAVTSTDSRNLTLAFTYDALGRPTGLFDTSPTGTQRASWTYDTLAKGQLTSSTRIDNGNSYTVAVNGYNDSYQPTGQTVTIPAAEGTELANSYTTYMSYNVDGSPAVVVLPAAGGLLGERLTYKYDAVLGTPTQLSTVYGGVSSTYVASTTFSELGQLLQTRLNTGTGGSVYEDFTYEVDTGRLHGSSVSRTSATPNMVTDTTYTYDNAGNITKIADAPKGGTADTQCFQQDYLGRLSEAWTPSSGNCDTAASTGGLGGAAPYWQSFTYDLSGNRLSQVKHAATGNETTTYATPAAGAAQPHRLDSTTTTDSAGTRTQNYTYDSAGNTKTRPGATGTQNLTWDAEGHLASMTEGGVTTSFLYGAGGTRLLRRDATGTTLYLGAMELRLNKTTRAVTATRYYSHTAGTVAVRTSAGVTWLASDPQGTSTVAITATTQQLQQRRQTPFGDPRGVAPTNWPGEKGFIGGDKDPTGLTHLGAREYDPQTGRFISVDPILNVGDPQQMHGYAYSNNNPINRSDPSGLSPSWGDVKEFIFQSVKLATEVAAFALCEGLTASWSLMISLPLCGAVSGAAGYLQEVIAERVEFKLEDLLNAALRGAEFAMGGAVAGEILRLAVGMIKQIAAKVFGKDADDIANALDSEANALPPASSKADEPQSGRPPNRSRDENPASTTKSNDQPETPTTSGKGDTPETSGPSTKSDSGGRSGGCKTHSFDPATLVLLADGSTKPIKDVAIGDQVRSTDPATGDTLDEPVEALFTNLDTDLTDVTVITPDGITTLLTTQHHPFWDDTTKTWTDAATLQPGHALRTTTGPARILLVHNHTGVKTMHDLTVANIHTYYVIAGTTPVLVHNCDQHVALGLEGAGLEDAAGKQGAQTLMNDKDWKGTVWTAANLLKSDNPGIRISFHLDGMQGVENGVASAVGQSLTRNARQLGGATDLEMAFFHDAGTLGKLDFFIGGIKQLNPFG